MSLSGDINNIFGTLTLLSQVVIVIAVVALIFRKSKFGQSFLMFFGNKALFLAFLVSLLATVGSLIYSKVIGFDPCELCWIQRIFVYPQVVILGVALLRSDPGVLVYSFWLSVVGILVSIYQYLLQMGLFSGGTGCVLIDGVSECARILVLSYGYITIPMMTLTTFASIIVLSSIRFFYEKF